MSGPRVTRAMSASETAAPPAPAAGFDFAAEFQRFLSDPSNHQLIQTAFCGPLLQEIRLLKEELAERNTKIKDLESTVAYLEDQNDALEQYTRRNSIRISGVAESEGESCDDVVLATINEKMAVSPPITLDHIDRLHRVGKKGTGKARQIIVKFTSYRHRARVMAKRRELRGSDIFVNEDLTRKRSQIMWHCRAEKRQHKLQDCWSFDGRISVKDLRGKVHSITKLENLYELTTPSTD